MRWVSRCSAWALDAVVVSSPVDDVLLDGFGLEVLGEGFADESGEFFVRGEAQGDQLLDAELVDVGAVRCREKSCETETLFQADDAVLSGQGSFAGCAC
jgi:hypothetical protein